MGKNSVASDIVTGDPFGAGRRTANAAQRVASAQQGEAKKAFNMVSGIVNPASVASLASLDRDISRQEKNLARQEQLISQLDPTIIEASQQALRLLRGETSSTLKPLQDQRSTQRQKLVNTLREQLGPGAETSTAGIQALTRFDAETDQLFSGAQQQALSNLGSLSAQFTSQRPDLFREIAGLSGFGQQKYQNELSRASILGNARMGLQNTAGAQYTGQLMMAQNQKAFGDQLMGAGIKAGTAYLTGGGSLLAEAGKPTPANDLGPITSETLSMPTLGSQYGR